MARHREQPSFRTSKEALDHINGWGGKLNHFSIMRRANSVAIKKAVDKRLQEMVTPDIDAMLKKNSSNDQIEAAIQIKFGTKHLPLAHLIKLIKDRRTALSKSKKLDRF
ncbi:MAG: hypothetical protein CL944_01825 [Candidatus Diapherotrites archaeon]|uniref:Uncharacterized protein n=1 Tax=Candidatus Iainarchaeum sp. TaxID=3101447 RepID=A0A2D6LPU7_9ARCH|nr:hypothetical protein [Candidatus Diapherotrites archaeon]|tara:strand:+ start:5425 stop:5751 length:327 start_codon:yes stop_codon:yes gene_type:complete